jgi:hypothetical protein
MLPAMDRLFPFSHWRYDMISMSIGSEHDGLSATLQGPTATSDVSFLCIRAGGMIVEINIFRRGPRAIEQLLDLGYEIVHECRELQERTASQSELASEGDLNV